MSILKQYKEYLFSINWKFPAMLWILIALGLSIGTGIIAYSTITLSALNVSPGLSLVLAFVVLDIVIAYPYLLALKRISSIEENLPDAFKQIGDTLKAGGTFEYALRGISTAEYGALSEEIDNILRRLQEGENLENSLKGFSQDVDSKLVKRSVNIIIDSVKSGAGLADVLDKISDDIRALHRIDQERKAGTIMQVLFLVSASSFVAPLILGMVSSILAFLIVAVATGADLTKKQLTEAIATKDLIVTLMQVYIFVEVVASAAMITMMREGKATRALIYIPILLLIAYVIYYLAVYIVNAMLGGI
ncbi:MAG: type II secretion system F family protein [archaeon]